jgi:phenylacetate-coenzyme A ligase PaaK-like adenylate-forming protein
MLRSFLYRAFSLLGEREALAFENDALDCGRAQAERLSQLVKANSDTKFGRKHKFESIRSLSDFQKSVPVNNYDDLSPYINEIADGAQNILTVEAPFMFATTSGTTGSRKLIPVTAQGFNYLWLQPSKKLSRSG